MKKISIAILIYLVQLSLVGCTQNQPAESPTGYDLANPVKFIMPTVLDEVSGIAFRNGSADTIFAQQDEEGKLFYFHLGDKDIRHTKFFKRGDFEDVAICNQYAILLRSDGALFTFPVNEMYKMEAGGVYEQDSLLSGGEFESLYADAATNTIYALCKSCRGDKKAGTVSGYTMQLSADGKLTAKGNFSIDVTTLEGLSGGKANLFKPSAMAKNPLTNEWYILSSVNKTLLVADAQWKPLKAYKLAVTQFTQPEGIAFDTPGNLYIANEIGPGLNGTVLQFLYKKK